MLSRGLWPPMMGATMVPVLTTGTGGALVTAESIGIFPASASVAAANTTNARNWVSTLTGAGGHVLFNNGKYQFDTTVGPAFPFGTINGRLTGRGAQNVTGTVGSGTNLLRKAGSNPIASWTGTGSTGTQRSHGGADFIGFDGNALTTGNPLVTASQANELTFFDVRFQNTPDQLFHGTQLWNCRWFGCWFTNGGTGTGTPAVLLDALSTGGCVTDHFIGCEWEGCTGTDLKINGDQASSSPCLEIIVSACKFERQVNSATYPVIEYGYTSTNTLSGNAISVGGTSSTSPLILIDSSAPAPTVSITGGDLHAGAPATVPYYIVVNGGGLSIAGVTFLYAPGTKYIQVASGVAAGAVNANPMANYFNDAPNSWIEDNRATPQGCTYQGWGAPSSALGNNGDYYDRTDGTSGSPGTHRYFKSSGAWNNFV